MPPILTGYDGRNINNATHDRSKHTVTQHFIRKNASYGPIRRAWAQLYEPLVLSAIYGIWYVAMLGIGLYSFFNPPTTIEAAAGDILMSAIAGPLALAGALGAATIATEDAWLESFVLGFGTLGWFAYEVTSLYLWANATTGNRGMATLGILGSLMFTGGRWYWVRKSVSLNAKKDDSNANS